MAEEKYTHEEFLAGLNRASELPDLIREARSLYVSRLVRKHGVDWISFHARRKALATNKIRILFKNGETVEFGPEPWGLSMSDTLGEHNEEIRLLEAELKELKRKFHL